MATTATWMNKDNLVPVEFKRRHRRRLSADVITTPKLRKRCAQCRRKIRHLRCFDNKAKTGFKICNSTNTNGRVVKRYR